MLQLVVVTTGTLFGRVAVGSREEGLAIGPELLERLGLRDGDVVEIHTDGEMLIVRRASDQRRAN